MTKSLSNIFNFLLLFILFSLPFIFSFSFSDYFIFPKEIYFIFFILIILNLFFLRLLFSKGAKIYYPTNYYYPLSIFVLLVCFQFFYNNQHLNYIYLTFYTFLAFFYFLLTQQIKNKLKEILFLLNFLALILGVLFFLQYFNLDILNQYAITKVPPKFLSLTFGHKNLLSEFMLFLIPVIFFTLKNEKLKFKKLVVFLALSFSILIIVLSFSRAAFLGLIIELILIFKMYNFSHKKIYLYFIFILGVSLFFIKYSPFYRGKISNKFSLNYEISQGSLMQRYFIWKAGTKMFFSNSLAGIGEGNIKYEFLNYYNKLSLTDKITYHYLNYPQENITYLHNDYLQILAESGFIIFTLFFCWSISLIVLAFKKNDLFLISLAISLIGILVDAFFAYPLHYITSQVFFFFYVALIQKDKYFIMKNKFLKIFLMVMVFLFSIFIIRYKTKDLFSEYYLQQAKISLRENPSDIDTPLKAANKAVEVNSKNYAAYFYLGNIYFYVKNYPLAFKNYAEAKKGISDLNLNLKYIESAYFTKKYFLVKNECNFIISLYLYDEHLVSCYVLLANIYKQKNFSKYLHFKNLLKQKLNF